MTAAVVTIGRDGLPAAVFRHPDSVQAQAFQRNCKVAPALVIRIEDQEVLSATPMSGVTRKALVAWAAEHLRSAPPPGEEGETRQPSAGEQPVASWAARERPEPSIDDEDDDDDGEPTSGHDEDDDDEEVRPPPAPPAPRARKPRAPRVPPTAIPPEEPMSTKAPARATCTMPNCTEPPGGVRANTQAEAAPLCNGHRKKVLDTKRQRGLSIKEAVAAVAAHAKGEAPAAKAARAPKPAKKPPVRPMRMPAAAPAGDDLTTMFREAQEALSLVRVIGWDITRAIAARVSGEQ